ncbi:hypothetical protein Tco_0394429 [Tanacetum coccineum]
MSKDDFSSHHLGFKKEVRYESHICKLTHGIIVLDGAFGRVGDEEVVVGEEGLEEEALVEFMVEWFEEDEDGKKNGKDDLFN